MKILVIGGSGFIGRHVTQVLLRQHHQVTVLDLLSAKLPEVQYILGSHDDRELLERVTHGQDAVVHLVSTTVPATSNQNVEFDIESNLVGAIRVLEAMRAQRVKRLVYLSSGGAVYGNPQAYPIAESHPLNPISSYGIVKVAIEKYIYMHQQLYGLLPAVLRPSNAYGPGQNLVKPQGVIGHFIRQSLVGEPLEVWGDGKIRRDYLYVSDLAELVSKALVTDECGVFNAGAGRDNSLLEIMDILEEVVGRRLEKRFLSSREYDVQRIRLDISNTESAFDWSPSVDLREGIRRQYAAALGSAS